MTIGIVFLKKLAKQQDMSFYNVIPLMTPSLNHFLEWICVWFGENIPNIKIH